MSEKNMRGFLISLLIVLCCLLLIACFVTELNHQEELLISDATSSPTPEITITLTNTPVVTSNTRATPQTIIIVTMGPTATSVPAATSVPEPTVIPTPVPTATPTAEPIATPTPESIATSTLEPIVAPNNLQKVEQIKNELSKLTLMGGIYVDYSAKPKHDLYEILDVEGVDSQTLFEELRKPFEKGIAIWTDMSFNESNSSAEMISKALNSSICPICDRVCITEKQDNFKQILSLFERIEREGEFETANRLLLNYLYEYTALNPQNSSERLILACNCE